MKPVPSTFWRVIGHLTIDYFIAFIVIKIVWKPSFSWWWLTAAFLPTTIVIVTHVLVDSTRLAISYGCYKWACHREVYIGDFGGWQNCQLLSEHMKEQDRMVRALSKTVDGWFKEDTSKYSSEDMTTIGLMHLHGQGIPQDHAQAFQWIEQAALRGHPPAEASLGALYQFGSGVEKDRDQAAHWFLKAAEAGDAQGQACIGHRFETGSEVENDLAECYKWYTLSAHQGNEDGKRMLAELLSRTRDKLTSQVIADGEQRARNFRPTKRKINT